jgi:hypothetical protein
MMTIDAHNEGVNLEKFEKLGLKNTPKKTK